LFLRIEGEDDAEKDDAMVAGSRWAGNNVLLTGPAKGFDQLVGAVVFDSNHAETSKRRKLMDSICGKIERLIVG